ncbi:MAG: lipopolysaccharide heptosyltransferase family protein [Melioribacteraceae bacterium]|nr:lipopolysaccharide heptosyltransferase family protein [Melioribacteraceae bacterium]MCF8266015.1 lipopolysaccharide heptosyltransferase family protein [Melioribacteraceae bacterium]MCF8432483.1 lipopolysaccharide heptosyltransferase family protein [Melioribacteraceae bacterium]
MENLRILIVRPDRLGDVVLATPIPREIKKQFPHAFIAVMVRKYTKDIFINNPHVDEILIFNEAKGTKVFFDNLKAIKSFDFTHAFMLLPHEKINWLLFLAGIKKRFGVGHKFYQFITNTKSVFRNKLNPLRHEADYCLDFARKIGVQSYNYKTEIHFSDTEKVEIDERQKKYLGTKKFLVAVHTSFGISSPNISDDEYYFLIKELSQNNSVQLCVTDFEPEQRILDLGNVLVLNKSGREFFMDIAAMEIMISSSTGPSHIAAAVGIKTLTAFCPLKACSFQLWSPMGNDAYYILPDEGYCSNLCSGNPKTCRFEGQGGIDHKKVIDKLKTILPGL